MLKTKTPVVLHIPFSVAIVFAACLVPFSVQGEEREAWTTSRIQGTPDPPPPYEAEALWPHITFNQGLDITLLESEESLFVSESFGKIWKLPADSESQPEAAELVADLNDLVPNLNRLLGLAFHPRFSSNRKIFLYYTVNKLAPGFDCVLKEFRMDEDWQVFPVGDEPLLRFHGEGHTGGDVQFGPDGMLYIPIGDLMPPSPPDANLSGQDLGQIGGKILRIDIDGRSPGLPYRIPDDNPFVGHEGARPEVWAYGLRNPWKLCFHPTNGDLWLGDVGWELWEMVHRIEKGGNYGWSIMEGPTPTNTKQASGPSPISSPIVAYDHYQGASVTGGYFVTSDRLPDLEGSYVYGDYVTGKIWALDWEDGFSGKSREIADTKQPIVTFGLDAKGDLLFLPFTHEASLYRLVEKPKNLDPAPFPRRLSETGLFTDARHQLPSPGVYAFRIKAPMWQEGARSDYWVAMPNKTKMTTSIEDRRGSPHVRYYEPEGMVLAKTIEISNRRIETQILHFDGYWKGYSYQWNEDQSDATLVGREGLNAHIEGRLYRFPSRDECFRCHGSNFNRPLAFFPGQINFDGQLERFQDMGFVDDVFVGAAEAQPLVDPYDDEEPIELRARSWLHSNCAHCHKVSGGSGLTAQMNVAVPNDKLELIGHPPTRGYFGLEGSPQIEPGNPYRSILYYRVATKGAGHMPMVGVPDLDKEGVLVVHDWIRSLLPEATLPQAALNPGNVEEALALYHRVQSGVLPEAVREQAIKNCLSHENPFIVNLFVGLESE